MNRSCPSATQPDKTFVSADFKLNKFGTGSQGKFKIAQLNEFFKIWHERPILIQEAASQVGVDFNTAMQWVAISRGSSSESLTEEYELCSSEMGEFPDFFKASAYMSMNDKMLEHITEGDSGFTLEFENSVEIQESNINEREKFCQYIMTKNIHYKANCLFIGGAIATCYARCHGVIHERNFKIYAAIDSSGNTRVTFERMTFGVETGEAPRNVQLNNFIARCILAFDFNTTGRGHLFLEEALAKQVTHLPKPVENSFILVPDSCSDLVPMKKFWSLLSLVVPDTKLERESFRTRIENLSFSIEPGMIKNLFSRPVTKFRDCLKESVLVNAKNCL